MNAASVFSWLFRASWQGSVVAALVLAAQWVFRRQLTARWQYALWFLVMVRLALPSLPSSAWSIYNCARSTRPVNKPNAAMASNPLDEWPAVPEAGKGAAPTVSELRQDRAVLSPLREDHVPQRTFNGPPFSFGAMDWKRAAMFCWLAGVIVLAARTVMQNLLFFARLREARDVAAEETRRVFEECKGTMGIRSFVSLRETALVKSPALYGFLRPVLLLPDGLLAQFNQRERRHIFLHELAHVKRRDMAANWLATVLGILHWPNPVLWFAFRRMAMDRELACDELALSRAGERESRPYGETVVRLLELCAQPAGLPGLIGILEDKREMIRRLSMIAHFGQQRKGSVLAAALALGLALVTLTDAQSSKAPVRQPETADQSATRPDLIGHVQRADGQPARVTVFIDSAGPKVGTSPFCPSCYADCRKSARTDSQGNFKIESLDPQLLFRILIAGEGWKPKFVNQVDPGHKPVEVTLDPLNLADVPPGQILRGRIVDKKGSAIEGAAVETMGIHTKDTAKWGNIDGLDPLAVSDAHGEFVITARQPFRSLDLKVEARGFSRRTFTEITGGEPSHDLQLTEGATIHGRVTLGGKPLANVSVGLVSEDRTIEHFTGDFEVGTDANGGFAFVHLPPNVRYHVYGMMSALKAYGATPIVTVEAGGDGSTTDAGELKAGPANRISGWVVLIGHEIRPKTRLLVGREDAWDSFLVDLGRGGSFDIGGVPSGIVSLSVDVPGTRLSANNASLDEINPFRLVGRVDHDITNLVILLEEGPPLEPQDRHYANSADLPELQGAEAATDHSRQRKISGRVTDAATGEPIATFRVTPGFNLYGDGDCDPSQAIDGNDGAYTVYFDKMAREPLLKIEAPGYVPMISQPFTQGQTNCDFAMTKGKPSDVALLGDPAGATPSGFLMDMGRRPASANRYSLDETETQDARRRIFFEKAEAPAPEEGTTLPENSEFVKYMSSPPWIKRMIYAHWQKYVAGYGPGEGQSVKWQIITNLAAIQPTGFFEQDLTSSPYRFMKGKEVGYKEVCGMSASCFWNAVESRQILFWSGTNITPGTFRERFLQKIRHIGLPALRPNSFKLGGSGEFSAETREGEAVSGRFVKTGASRPLALTYTVGERTNEVFEVNYRYDSTNRLPSYIELLIPVGKNTRTKASLFVSITHIEYGIDPRISQGYKPSQFYADMHTFESIEDFRDGGRFEVEPNGAQTKIDN